MSVLATRRLDFCAGHRVVGHENKCARLHGHNYTVYVHAEGIDRPVDTLGRVLDFSVLKACMGGFIDTRLDHNMLLWQHDTATLQALQALGGQQIYSMADNPTAENIGKHLLLDIAPQVLQDWPVRVVKIVVWETPNCYATVSL